MVEGGETQQRGGDSGGDSRGGELGGGELGGPEPPSLAMQEETKASPSPS